MEPADLTGLQAPVRWPTLRANPAQCRPQGSAAPSARVCQEAEASALQTRGLLLESSGSSRKAGGFASSSASSSHSAWGWRTGPGSRRQWDMAGNPSLSISSTRDAPAPAPITKHWGCCQPSNGPESEESGYKYILKLTCCLVSAWIFLLLTRRVFLISGFSGILLSGGFLPSAPPMPVPSEPGSDPSRRPPAGGREKPAEPWAPGLLAPRLWAEFPRALPTSPRLSLPPG